MSYRRKLEDKHRLKHLSQEHGNAYFDQIKQRYVRYYDSGRKWCRKKALKRASAKIIRHSADNFQQHNRHKRQFDYWWALY